MTPHQESAIGRKMLKLAESEGHNPKLPRNVPKHEGADDDAEKISGTIFLAIGEHGPISMAEIGKLTGISRHRVSSAIAYLMDRGIIEKIVTKMRSFEYSLK